MVVRCEHNDHNICPVAVKFANCVHAHYQRVCTEQRLVGVFLFVVVGKYCYQLGRPVFLPPMQCILDIPSRLGTES